ncbi:hypothetical protein ASE25_19305 [Terrabacter sp. Root85]|uniref:hypothetical protein n=1 Tax=Terrabacter sp. Root85 TaxID=1736603 RepID=UPI0006FCE141|nr:hypothetical protein [Terrabacter sp. Root85]KRC85199.1 hypothetical protein ASE25_19305 [Terrabacter sp. Root85]
MDVAELVLQYLQALAWPLVAVGALIAFRRQVSEKIGQLKDVNTPIGGGTFFDKAAREVEASADAAAEDQTLQPISGSDGEPSASEAGAEVNGAKEPSLRAEDLGNPVVERAIRWMTNNEREFELARKVAIVDPNAAVLTAFRYLEQIASDGAAQAGVPPRERRSALASVEALSHKGLTDEFNPVVRNLVGLRNDVTHGGADVSLSAALSFIAAAERVGTAIRGLTLSRAIHPGMQARSEMILGEPRAG